MKKRMYTSNVISPSNFKNILACTDKGKLETFLQDERFTGFRIGKIRLSGFCYCEDGDTAIHVVPIGREEG